MTMANWILFVAEDDQPNWETRMLTHSNSMTNILCEHKDYSGNPPPAVGYRPTETVRVERYADPDYPDASTHYREGDWVVTRVEEFLPDALSILFDSIVVCYCKYDPMASVLIPFDDR